MNRVLMDEQETMLALPSWRERNDHAQARLVGYFPGDEVLVAFLDAVPMSIWRRWFVTWESWVREGWRVHFDWVQDEEWDVTRHLTADDVDLVLRLHTPAP